MYHYSMRTTRKAVDFDVIAFSLCRGAQNARYMFPKENLVTVWSAPNYCYRCGNIASILAFDDAGG
jgi:diadenosine tetraphosphatase ApaH/serine/threonine PP2A family protein phosphatase